MAKKVDNENVQTLAQLMNVKKQLQMQAIENLGEMDEAMVRVWESTEIAIPAKLDGYGFILDKLESEKDFLDQEIRAAQDAKRSIDNAVKTMKKRLNYFANGDKLEGVKYSFSPFDSAKSEVQMFLLPKDAGRYALPDVTYKELQDIVAGLRVLAGIADEITSPAINALAERFISEPVQKCGVKEAPEDCVIKIMEPSVRIGRKASKTKED